MRGLKAARSWCVAALWLGAEAADVLKVFSLETYERLAFIQGHKGSVLGLCLSDSGRLLFSSAGDRIVNVSNLVFVAGQMSYQARFGIPKPLFESIPSIRLMISATFSASHTHQRGALCILVRRTLAYRFEQRHRANHQRSTD